MLNRVILMGRITQDLEIRQTQGGVAVLSFTVAVDRGYVKQGEERQTDFINCVAWRQQAEFISISHTIPTVLYKKVDTGIITSTSVSSVLNTE